MPTATHDHHHRQLGLLRQRVVRLRDLLRDAADTGRTLPPARCRVLAQDLTLLSDSTMTVPAASLRLTAVAAVISWRAQSLPYRAPLPAELVALAGRLDLAIAALPALADEPAGRDAEVIDLAAHRAARARPTAGPAPLPPAAGPAA